MFSINLICSKKSCNVTKKTLSDEKETMPCRELMATLTFEGKSGTQSGNGSRSDRLEGDVLDLFHNLIFHFA